MRFSRSNDRNGTIFRNESGSICVSSGCRREDELKRWLKVEPLKIRRREREGKKSIVLRYLRAV